MRLLFIIFVRSLHANWWWSSLNMIQADGFSPLIGAPWVCCGARRGWGPVSKRFQSRAFDFRTWPPSTCCLWADWGVACHGLPGAVTRDHYQLNLLVIVCHSGESWRITIKHFVHLGIVGTLFWNPSQKIRSFITLSSVSNRVWWLPCALTIGECVYMFCLFWLSLLLLESVYLQLKVRHACFRLTGDICNDYLGSSNTLCYNVGAVIMLVRPGTVRENACWSLVKTLQALESSDFLGYQHSDYWRRLLVATSQCSEVRSTRITHLWRETTTTTCYLLYMCFFF